MGTDSGMILRALSGFYYVYTGTETVTCRARGKFRHQRVTPLVGDRVAITYAPGEGDLLAASAVERK